MDIETVRKQDNPLLKRTELEFVVHHLGENTPTRDKVRELVASTLKGKKENVVVDRLNSEFGRASTKGYAKLYENADAAKAAEPEHLLVRNGIVKKKEEA